MKKVLILAALAVAGCNDSPTTSKVIGNTIRSLAGSPIAAGVGLALDTAIDYSASAVDGFGTASASVTHPDLMVADGDAILRRAGDVAVIVNRGKSSNIIIVDGSLAPVAQVSVPGCGPHDVAVLDDHRALLTCFNKAVMAIVDFTTGEVTDGPDLTAFADADGNPEMDQIGHGGGAFWVSLELLDERTDFWTPSGPGLVVALDDTTLEPIDLDPATPGVQGLSVCTNPYSRFAPAPDGRLLLGCSGIYGMPDTSAIVAVDPVKRSVSTVAEAAAVPGQLSDVRVDEAGRVFFVVSYPLTKAFEMPQDMRLMRLDAGGATTLYSAALVNQTDQGLGGFAFAGDGTVWVANRSADSRGGLWRVPAAGGDATGPVGTTLPPLDLEIF